MKKRLLPLSVASLLALLPPAIAQENPSPSPSPEATATTTPTPTPTASPSPAADADSSSSASTASPEEIAAAAAKTGDTPAASPSPAASPASAAAPPPPAAAATPEASPTAEAANAEAAPVDDADFLPEPTDAGLGAPIDEPLPVGEVATDELPDPDTLIPDTISDAADLPPAPPVAVENKFEKERKLRVRYQEVKLQALKDPAVRSFTDQAERAKTDEAKRQALREYYRTLFARMIAIDAELESKCDTMQQAYLRRLGQYRVSPAIPLAPPPTPEPLAN